MRSTSTVLTAAVASVTVALLAGCSGGSPSSSGSLPANGLQSQTNVRSAHQRLDATGVAPKFLGMLKFGHAAPTPNRRHAAGFELAVSDFGTNAVEILNKHYQNTSTITNGLNGPDGDWYDNQGNLYVANYAGVNVTEYNPSGTLTNTYSSGLTDPIGVTTDKHNNVYVADYGDGQASVVVEYAQGSNTPTASCATGLANEGIVVDKMGNVFVSGQNPNTGSGNIVELTGGVSACSVTTLGITLTFAGGLQMDKHKNLVACDQEEGAEIVPPPYTSASSTIPSDCFHVALNSKQTRVFIAQVNDDNVLVAKYPSGTTVTTLGASNGLVDPAGVATYPYAK